MNEAGTGSVASGSIGGNPFLQRFHKHRRCSRIYLFTCCIPRSHSVSRFSRSIPAFVARPALG